MRVGTFCARRVGKGILTVLPSVVGGSIDKVYEDIGQFSGAND